jgi:hypothetical protein
VGWVTVRCIGATDGAVLVGGGAEKVRDPRLPMLPPPPTRASAALISTPTVKAAATTAVSLVNLKPIMRTSRHPSAVADGVALIPVTQANIS